MMMCGAPYAGVRLRSAPHAGTGAASRSRRPVLTPLAAAARPISGVPFARARAQRADSEVLAKIA